MNCYATISPLSSRYPTWLEVFGSDTVPLESDQTVIGIAPNLEGPRRFYLVDLAELNDTTFEHLYSYVNGRFREASPREYKAIRRCPVLAEDVTVSYRGEFYI